MSSRRRPRADDPPEEKSSDDFSSDEELSDEDHSRTDLPYLSSTEFKKLMNSAKEPKRKKRKSRDPSETKTPRRIPSPRGMSGRNFDDVALSSRVPPGARSSADDVAFGIDAGDITPPRKRLSIDDIIFGDTPSQVHSNVDDTTFGGDTTPFVRSSSDDIDRAYTPYVARSSSDDTAFNGLSGGLSVGSSIGDSNTHVPSVVRPDDVVMSVSSASDNKAQVERKRRVNYVRGIRRICLNLFNSNIDVRSICVKLPYCSKVLIIREMIDYVIMAKHAGRRTSYTVKKIQKILLNYLRYTKDIATRFKNFNNDSHQLVYSYTTLLHGLRINAMVNGILRDDIPESYLSVIGTALRSDVENDFIEEETEENDRYPFVRLPMFKMMYMFSVCYDDRKNTYKILQKNKYPSNYESRGLFERYERDVLEASDSKNWEQIGYYIFSVVANTDDKEFRYLVYVDGRENTIKVQEDTSSEFVVFDKESILNPDINTSDRMRAIMQYVYGCVIYIPWKWNV